MLTYAAGFAGRRPGGVLPPRASSAKVSRAAEVWQSSSCRFDRYVSIRPHTSAYVSIRQHTSAYIRIRQHTPAYIRIRQHGRGEVVRDKRVSSRTAQLLRQYLYFCTGKASKLSTCDPTLGAHCDPSIRQHTSAYVSIRQHTSAYGTIRQHTSANASIRRHTSAYFVCR